MGGGLFDRAPNLARPDLAPTQMRREARRPLLGRQVPRLGVTSERRLDEAVQAGEGAGLARRPETETPGPVRRAGVQRPGRERSGRRPGAAGSQRRRRRRRFEVADPRPGGAPERREHLVDLARAVGQGAGLDQEGGVGGAGLDADPGHARLHRAVELRRAGIGQPVPGQPPRAGAFSQIGEDLDRIAAAQHQSRPQPRQILAEGR